MINKQVNSAVVGVVLYYIFMLNLFNIQISLSFEYNNINEYNIICVILQATNYLSMSNTLYHIFIIIGVDRLYLFFIDLNTEYVSINLVNIF